MGLLRNVAIVVLLISFVTFVALFGRLPALRNTPVAFLHRVIWLHIPKALQWADAQITGGRLQTYSSRTAHYLVYEKNPVVLILFLSLLTGSVSLFLSAAWSRLGLVNHVIIVLLLPQPYLLTYLCVISKHSYIHAANHAYQMRIYPYDHTLYYPGRRCITCQHVKPPRSKHCSICRACVGRSDHHCVWVNNCLGQENYRWFLALLASLGCILSYGAVLAYIILRRTSIPSLTGKGASGFFALLDRISIALASDARIGGVGLLAALTAPLAWGLLGYHVYLIWAGMTTNETMKWDDLKEDMADGLVYKGERRSRDDDEQPSNTDPDEEPATTWPNHSKQLIVRTDGGKAPAEEFEHGSNFERCWHLRDIDNVYDLGFWSNLLDALNLL